MWIICLWCYVCVGILCTLQTSRLQQVFKFLSSCVSFHPSILRSNFYYLIKCKKEIIKILFSLFQIYSIQKRKKKTLEHFFGSDDAVKSTIIVNFMNKPWNLWPHSRSISHKIKRSWIFDLILWVFHIKITNHRYHSLSISMKQNKRHGYLASFSGHFT